MKTYSIIFIDRENNISGEFLGKKSYYVVIAQFIGSYVSYRTDLKITKKHSKCYKVNFKNETIATFKNIEDAKLFSIQYAQENNL